MIMAKMIITRDQTADTINRTYPQRLTAHHLFETAVRLPPGRPAPTSHGCALGSFSSRYSLARPWGAHHLLETARSRPAGVALRPREGAEAPAVQTLAPLL